MVSHKKLFIVIGILFFALHCFAQIEAPKCGVDKIEIDEQRNMIKNNNIRQKIKLENSKMGDAMTMEKMRTEVITFDNEGKITEWAYYKNNARVEAIYRYVYDSKGNISELTLFSDIGDVLEKTIYSYNTSGYLSQETFFEAGNTFVSRSVYETDMATKKITETEYSVNNDPVSKRVYFYSDLDSGNVIKKEVYKQGNNLYYIVEFAYNENGKLEKEDYYSSSGNLAYKFVYKYDESGNNTEKIKYTPTNYVLQRYSNVYTKSGLERGITEFDKLGRIVTSVEYQYEN